MSFHYTRYFRQSAAPVIAALLWALPAYAQGSSADSAQQETAKAKLHILEGLTVTGTAGDVGEVGGSATFIGQEEIEKFSYTDINRTLRLVPGVQLQEEDGYGLRPNIGIRGSGSDRNNKIVIMEDSVLIAPAPYAAPAAYYFPSMGRMEAIEVVKGPAAIKYGPSTVAGAINLFSTSIPDNEDGRLSGSVTVLGGEDSTLRVHGYAGGWMPMSDAWDVGILVETLQDRTDGFKELDGGGDTGYRIQDYLAKLAFRSTAESGLRQSFEFKVQRSDEVSDETYLGLTLADFNATPYRRYAASQVDEMNVDHLTLQASHRVDFSNDLNLTTTLYYNDTSRAWYKINDDALLQRYEPCLVQDQRRKAHRRAFMDKHFQHRFGSRHECRRICRSARSRRRDPRPQQQSRVLFGRHPVRPRIGIRHRGPRALSRVLGALP